MDREEEVVDLTLTEDEHGRHVQAEEAVRHLQEVLASRQREEQVASRQREEEVASRQREEDRERITQLERMAQGAFEEACEAIAA